MLEDGAPNFGEMLRRYRIGASLTQEELAKRAGLSARGLRDLERGKRPAPHRETAQRLATALALGPSERAALLAGRPSRAPRRSQTTEPEHLAPKQVLPESLTSFVGRERELAELQTLLAHKRLLTLTGVGGVGKTRLALELARRSAADDLDDVALIDLAPLVDPDFVLSAVAAAANTREQPQRPLLDTLVDVLRSRHRLLLILDNCEHLIVAAAGLANDLLRRCAELRILATSREPLGISGEVVRRVPPLSLPSVRSAPLAARLHDSEAVQLFLARAAAVDQDFVADEPNAAAVAEICRRLDGIPLALELAAARVGLLGVQQIARRIDDRFRLLTSGSRTAPARQQTLRATFEWSYELLSDPERRLFERLGVFAGGWTLEAAERVCAGDWLEVEHILDTLGQLASKSLVVTEPARDGAMHYRLLETLRQFAAELLLARGDMDALRARHADFFLSLAEQVAPRAQDADPALDELEREHDNLRAALRWLIDRHDIDNAQRLGAAVGRLWFFRAYLTEGRAWLAELLAMPARNGPTLARTELLYRLGMLAWVQGDAASARAPLDEALELAQRLGDRRAAAQALFALGHLARTAGERALARDWYSQSVEVARNAGLQRHETIALLGLGWVAHDTGDSATAYARLEEVLALARRMDWSTLALQALVILGDVRRQNGEYEAACSLTGQALALARHVGARWWIASASVALAHALAWQGDAGADELARESLALAYELGDHPGIARAMEVLVHLASDNGQAEHSLRLAGAATRLRISAGPPLAPRDRERLEQCVATARRLLGSRISDAAWADGCALSLADAVGLALEAPSVPLTRQQERPAGGLTPREREVVALIGRGFSNRRIAEELVIAESTAVRHVSNILGKLGLNTRSEVAVWAVHEHLDARTGR